MAPSSVEQFGPLLKIIALETKDFVKAQIEEASAPLLAKLADLERTIAELRQREYQGVWDSTKRYAKGAMVTRQGALWHSNIDDNGSKPGESPNWTLAVKRGAAQ